MSCGVLCGRPPAGRGPLRWRLGLGAKRVWPSPLKIGAPSASTSGVAGFGERRCPRRSLRGPVGLPRGKLAPAAFPPMAFARGPRADRELEFGPPEFGPPRLCAFTSKLDIPIGPTNAARPAPARPRMGPLPRLGRPSRGRSLPGAPPKSNSPPPARTGLDPAPP